MDHADARVAEADALLARLFDEAGLRGTPGAALLAVGGYGRGTLSPYSDLDVLLLHPRPREAPAERLWYPVWDAGHALDHAVRTPAEAAALARGDLKVHLGLLDARPLCGDPGTAQRLRATALADWRATAPRRLPELHALCRERAERHGELAHLAEPDLKEARGGLRDLAVLRAVAASWIADPPREGLREAGEVLLEVRAALHLATGRATDRITPADRPAVAARLGLLDGDQLLRRIHEAARTVAHASDLAWREVNRVLSARRPGGGRRLGALRRRGGPLPADGGRPLADGVVEQDGEAVLSSRARPERDPVLLLRAAAAAARAGIPLSPHAAARLANCPPLPVPWPAEARDALLALLGAGAAALPVWEVLDGCRLVGRVIPDWERVRCRPQTSPPHRWTVDRHLLETAARAASGTRRVHRPDLLLLAALLHGLGKGWPGDPAVAGTTAARDLAARTGLPPRDADTVALLVRHHRLLLRTADRRDPDDPATAVPVAEAVGDLRTLELLHVLTEADARATGPEVWTPWRERQTAVLVERVAARLAGDGPAEPARPADPDRVRLAAAAARSGAVELTVRQDGPGAAEILLAAPGGEALLAPASGVLALHRLAVRAAAAEPLGPATVLSWTVATDGGPLPEAARLRRDLDRARSGELRLESRLAARDAAARPPLPGLPGPRATVADGASAQATVVEVRASDGPGLLHRIAAALDAAGVQVRRARAAAFGADAVDTFYVVDAAGRPLGPDAAAAVAAAVEGSLRDRPQGR